MKIEIREYRPPAEKMVMLWIDDRNSGCLECVPRHLASLIIYSIGLKEWLKDEVDIAQESVNENRKDGGDPNSYGNGYDSGFLAALKSVQNYMEDQ